MLSRVFFNPLSWLLHFATCAVPLIWPIFRPPKPYYKVIRANYVLLDEDFRSGSVPCPGPPAQ